MEDRECSIPSILITFGSLPVEMKSSRSEVGHAVGYYSRSETSHFFNYISAETASISQLNIKSFFELHIVQHKREE